MFGSARNERIRSKRFISIGWISAPAVCTTTAPSTACSLRPSRSARSWSRSRATKSAMPSRTAPGRVRRCLADGRLECGNRPAAAAGDAPDECGGVLGGLLGEGLGKIFSTRADDGGSSDVRSGSHGQERRGRGHKRSGRRGLSSFGSHVRDHGNTRSEDVASHVAGGVEEPARRIDAYDRDLRVLVLGFAERTREEPRRDLVDGAVQHDDGDRPLCVLRGCVVSSCQRHRHGDERHTRADSSGLHNS